MILTPQFFNRDACEVAQDLLGKVLRHHYQGIWLSAQIIETEAYTLEDKASHASLGFTQKRRALFMPPGTIYMYYARGADSFNISCKGEGNAVLLKSGVPYINQHAADKMLKCMQQLNPKKNTGQRREIQKLCQGQTLLCKSLGLKVKDWDARVFDPEKLYIVSRNYQPEKIIRTTRLGIPKGRDEHLLYRFIDYDFVKSSTQNPLTKRHAREGLDWVLA